MNEKFKRIDKKFILSDSSVNVYGYRLLTSGFQLPQYQKNPIGYYMHRREEGIVLKWEDIAIEDDNVVGYPVINLAHPKGEQLFNEVSNGFLNAASVGHIVVLEHSNDPNLMLPGQTGPTITRWYNKECSLVDIPGNANALTTLYDAQENLLNLSDISTTTLLPIGSITAIAQALALPANASPQLVHESVLQLQHNLSAARTLCATQAQQLLGLEQQLARIEAKATEAELQTILADATTKGKITQAAAQRLATDYATNIPALKELIATLPVYTPISAILSSTKQSDDWTWDDYVKNDPDGKALQHLKQNNPDKYKQLYNLRFGAQ